MKGCENSGKKAKHLRFVYNVEEFDKIRVRAMHRFVRSLSSFGKVVSPMDFKPKKALIVTKVSRYEFERHKHKEMSEIDFENLLTKRGSDYTMIRYSSQKSSVFDRE